MGRHSSYVRQPHLGPVPLRGLALFFLSVGSTNPLPILRRQGSQPTTSDALRPWPCRSPLRPCPRPCRSPLRPCPPRGQPSLWPRRRTTIGLAFGLEVLIAGEASDGLFGPTLRLISLSSHRAPPSLRATPGSAVSTLLLCPHVSALTGGESHVASPRASTTPGKSPSVPGARHYVRKITAADRNASPAQINVAHMVLSMKAMIPAMMNRITAIRAKT